MTKIFRFIYFCFLPLEIVEVNSQILGPFTSKMTFAICLDIELQKNLQVKSNFKTKQKQTLIITFRIYFYVVRFRILIKVCVF